MQTAGEMERCPVCNDPVSIDRYVGFTAICRNCYDGAPDAGPQLIAYGTTYEEVTDEWNEAVADYRDSVDA
jgi:hypothetical protein